MNKTRTILIAATVTASTLLASCAPPAPTLPAPPQPSLSAGGNGGSRTPTTPLLTMPSAQTITAAEQRLLALTNTARGNTAPLVWSNSLATGARQWAAIMPCGVTCAHDTEWVEGTHPGWSAVGENVAEVRISQGSAAAIAAELHAAWVASPDHYNQMKNPAYTHMGAGISVELTTIPGGSEPQLRVSAVVRFGTAAV